MYIFLPHEKAGLKKLLQNFHSNDALFHGKFDLTRQKFDVLWIPKFKISSKSEAKDVFNKLRADLFLRFFVRSIGVTVKHANSEANVLAEWNALYDAYNEVACLMLESMTPELHRQFKNYSPYDMLQELKSMFEKQTGVERFDLIQTFHACKHEEGKPVGAYVLKMKDYMEQVERLGYVLLHDLSVGLILNGLTSDFTGFVRNYNMPNMGKTIGELHVMLIEYEKGLPKKAETPQVMMIKGGKIQKSNKKSLKAKGKGKANGKGKDKHGYISKPKNPKPTAKEHPAKDDTCHHCKEVGHWKRNCLVFLAELLKKKKQVGTASSSDAFIIELFSFPTKSWVYDTSCGTHICNTKHGLEGVRKAETS
ncbi:retrotransposon protein, putative, ty1-copia subclass [Tanacetum coccineum]